MYSVGKALRSPYCPNHDDSSRRNILTDNKWSGMEPGLHRGRWGVGMMGHWIIWLWHYRNGTWGLRNNGLWHCHVRTQDTGLLDCDSYFGTWALSLLRHYRTPIPKWNNMFATSWTIMHIASYRSTALPKLWQSFFLSSMWARVTDSTHGIQRWKILWVQWWGLNPLTAF